MLSVPSQQNRCIGMPGATRAVADLSQAQRREEQAQVVNLQGLVNRLQMQLAEDKEKLQEQVTVSFAFGRVAVRLLDAGSVAGAAAEGTRRREATGAGGQGELATARAKARRRSGAVEAGSGS